MIRSKFYRHGDLCIGDEVLADLCGTISNLVPGVIKNVSIDGANLTGMITEICFVSSVTDNIHSVPMGHFWKVKDIFKGGVNTHVDCSDANQNDPEVIRLKVQPELFGKPTYMYSCVPTYKDELINYYSYPVLVSQVIREGPDAFFVIVGIKLESQEYCHTCSNRNYSYFIPLPENHLKVVEQLARCRGFCGRRTAWSGNDAYMGPFPHNSFECRLQGKRKGEFLHGYKMPGEKEVLFPYSGRMVLSFEASMSHGNGYYSVIVGVVDSYKSGTNKDNLSTSAITIIPDYDRAMIEVEARKLGLRGPISFWTEL